MNESTIQIGDKFNPHGLFNGIHIPDAMCRTEIISWSAKACWGKLKEYAGKDGFCFPQQKQLAENLGLSLSTVQRSLKELEDQKFIVIEKPKNHQRLMHLNHKYFFLFHKILSSGMKLAMCQNDVSAGGQNDVSAGGQNDVSNIKESYIKDSSVKELTAKAVNSKTDVLHPAPNKINKRGKGDLLIQAKINVDKPLIHKKQKTPYEPSAKALHLMRYWEGKGLKSISHDPTTKVYEQSLMAFDKLLSGTVFNGTEFENYEHRKIDIKDIRKAIDRFALMALHHDYEPRTISFKKILSKMYPSVFIYSDFRKSNNGYGRSHFVYCLENDAKLIKEKDVTVEDKYPNVTNAIINKYKSEILGGNSITFTNDDINSFRKASNFAYELFMKNRNRLMGTYANMEPFRIADCMFEALTRSGVDLCRVKPYWLCNNAMQQQLPAYLYQSAIFQDTDCTAKSKTLHYYNFGVPFEG